MRKLLQSKERLTSLKLTWSAAQRMKGFAILVIIQISLMSPIMAQQIAWEIEPDVDNCVAGKISEESIEKIVELVNSIRKLHKMAPIPWDNDYDTATQTAALQCAANGYIDHYATMTKCESAIGDSGRSNSNLHQGWPPTETYEDIIISWLIDEHNSGDLPGVGHRRLVLNPFIKSFSYGEVSSEYKFAAFSGGDIANMEASQCEIDFVAYPYENYPPRLVNKEFYLNFQPILGSWYPFIECDFSNVKIEMTDSEGNKINVSDINFDYLAKGGFKNNISWKAAGLKDSVKYDVKLSNVIIAGESKSYEYWFKLTDPTEAPLAEIPTLLQPVDNAIDIESPVTLSWTSAPNADHYNLQISNSNDFNNILFESENITDTSLIAELTLESQTTYYWKVETFNLDDISAGWSTAFKFTSKEIIMPPGVPTLASPENNAQNVWTPITFTWNADNATSYRLQLATSHSFSDIILEINDLQTNSYEYNGSALQPGTNYFWRVKAINKLYVASDWSAMYRFTTTTEVSAIPVAVFPTNNTLGIGRQETYKWTGVSNASSYILQIATDDQFTNSYLVVEQADITTENYSLKDEQILQPETEHFWRVRATLANSTQTEWSATTSFTTGKELHITESLENVTVTLYPNPIYDNAIISISSEQIGKYVSIEIYNLLGTKVLDVWSGNIGTNNTTIRVIPTKDMENGTYFCKISIDNRYKIIPLNLIIDN